MKKRAISLLLAMVMILSTIASPIYAVGQNLPKDKVEAGNEVPYTNEGNKKIFKIDKRAIKEVKEPALRSALQSNRLRRAPINATRKETMTVKLTTKGLGNGAQNFDWSLFNNSKFTGELLIYDVDDNEYYPEKDGKRVTIDFTQDGEQKIEFEVPVGLDVDSYNIVVKTIDNFEVRATYTNASTSPSGAELKLEFTVIELASPVVEVIYKDPQGQNLAADKLPTTTGVNITADGVKLAGANLSIPLPTAQYTKYNIAQGITGKGRATTQELNNLTDAIKYKVDGKDSGLITLDDKEFKLSITNSLKDGSQIVLTLSKADQLRELGGLNPKTIKVWKDDNIDWKNGVEPVDKNSDAAWKLIEEATVTDITVPTRDSSKAGKFPGKLKITFDDGSSLEVDNQWLYVWEHVVVIDPNNTDPDAPKEEDLPSKKVKVLFEAKPNGGVKSITTKGTTFAKIGTVLQDKDFPQDENIKFENGYKGPVTWTPEKTTPVKNSGPGFAKGKGFIFKASANQETTADKIKALGGLKGVDFAVWKGTSTAGKFWNKGIAPADSITDATNKKTVQDAIDAATVTDTTTTARTTSATGTFPGTLKVTFADGSVYEVTAAQGQTAADTNIAQTLYVYDKGDTKPDPKPGGGETPVPEGTIFVEFTRDTTSIKEEGFKNLKPLMYAAGDTVDAQKFPNAQAAEGYNPATVTWTPAKENAKVDTSNTDAYKEATKTFTFKASATKNDTTADKIKALGGLKGVDFGAWKDTSTAGKFWNKGIAPADGVQAANKQTVQDAIDAATVTDTTTTARTTSATGTFPGTLKVTFADGSVYEVTAAQGQTAADTNIAQTLYVYDKGDTKPDPKPGGGETPVPEGTIFVEFTRDTTSIKEEGFKNLKPLMYAAGDTVDAQKFPNAQAAEGYNPATVTWTPAKENATVDTSNTTAYNAQTKTFTFKASASSNTPTKNSEDYDPHYTGKSGKPGETVQIDAPTFTKKGVTGNVQAPSGTTFANNDPTQTNVTVDRDTGAITVVIPQDKPVGSTITIEVKVTYPDNSNDTVKVTVTVSDNTQPKPEEDKSKTPIVDPVDDGDTSISGKGEPGSDIIINIPGKDPIKTTVDEGGKWTAPIDPAHEGDVIEVIQIEVGKKPSDPAYVTVGGRSIIVPGHDDGGHWWFGGGSFKPVETEEQVIDKTEHGIHIAYIFGYKDHTFRCEGKITRAEAASMIAHIAKLDLSDNSKPDFKDTPSSWYNAAINAMVKKNLMFADKNGNFRPNEPITRGEFARAIQFIDKENKKEAPFMDIKGHEFEEAINQAYSNGRIAGYPDGTFKPDESITRAEAVTILNNFDGRMVRERGIEDVKKDLIKFTDLIPSHWAYYEIIEASNSHAYSRISNDSKEEKWSNLIK